MDEPEVIPYVPDISLPKAVIAGIDGTVALRGDQDQMVRYWRKLRLQCFQVSDGTF